VQKHTKPCLSHGRSGLAGDWELLRRICKYWALARPEAQVRKSKMKMQQANMASRSDPFDS